MEQAKVRERRESMDLHESLNVVERVDQHERVKPVKSLDFQREMEPGCPSPPSQWCTRAALRLTSIRVTRAAASRRTLGPECIGESFSR